MAVVEELSPDTHAKILAAQKKFVNKFVVKIEELLGDGAVDKLKELLVIAKGTDDDKNGVIDASEARRGRRCAAIVAAFWCLKGLVKCCQKKCPGCCACSCCDSSGDDASKHSQDAVEEKFGEQNFRV